MKWSDEEISFLTANAKDGVSGQDLADMFTEKFGRAFTRSMILSKANRIGIHINAALVAYRAKFAENRKNGIPNQVKPRVRNRTKPARVPEQDKNITIPLWLMSLALSLPESACTILELNRHRCKFPLWPHPMRAQVNFPYCGAPTSDNTPWCKDHQKVVFNAQTTFRPRSNYHPRPYKR